MKRERRDFHRELSRTPTGDASIPASHPLRARHKHHHHDRSAKLQRDFREKLRTMLLAHIGAMREEGLVFEHVFEERRLGIHIALARYGDEGREFIQIDGTEPFCDLYPGPLKPTDELIAYDDTIIVEPRTTSFDKLRDAIAHSPRPLKLTFIEGERRDEAFREQEERRSMARNDVRIRCNREALAAAHAAQVVAHADAHGRVNASCEAALHSIVEPVALRHTAELPAAHHDGLRHESVRRARRARDAAVQAAVHADEATDHWLASRLVLSLDDDDDDDALAGAEPPDDDDDVDVEYAGALLPAVGAADDPGLAAAAAPFFGPPPPPPRPAPPPPSRPRSPLVAPRKAPSVARAERAVARLERALDDADGALATPARRRPAPSVPVTHSATWQRVLEAAAPTTPRTWQATLEGADPALTPPLSPWFAAQFLVSEVERMRGQVHERDELVKVLRDQLDEILTAKDLEERGTQTTIVRHRGAMSQTTLTGDVEASAGDDGDGGGGGEGLGDGRRRTTLRRSMARRRTRAEAPLGNAGPVSQLLEAIYDVHEKKLLADAEAATSGRVPASLDEFVRGYWRDKFRHRKAANKRMAWMFTAIREHMMHNRHVRIVGWVLGMDLTFIMQKEYHYGPMISRMFYSFLAAVVEQDPSLVKRTFDADGKPASKPLAFMLDCLIGLGREGVERDKPGTWKSHQLKLMMRDTHIEGMLARIEAAADADGLVDLDFVFHALMESYNDAIFAHKTQLTKAFYRFDTGTEGMTKEEFIELLRFVLGQNRIKEMSDEELDEIYHRVEDIADDDEECMQIDDGESFASAVLICDFELSLPKFCRAHWSLPDDSDDNRHAPLMARDEADASGSLADVASDIVVRTSFAMTGDASS